MDLKQIALAPLRIILAVMFLGLALIPMVISYLALVAISVIYDTLAGAIYVLSFGEAGYLLGNLSNRLGTQAGYLIKWYGTNAVGLLPYTSRGNLTVFPEIVKDSGEYDPEWN